MVGDCGQHESIPNLVSELIPAEPVLIIPAVRGICFGRAAMPGLRPGASLATL
jgi:hypothetical protein